MTESGNSDLVVWGRETSSNVQAVLWALDELGVDFERRDIGGRYGGLDGADFRAMNPHGRIPVLSGGGLEVPIFESAAILRYLATRFGSAPFWPEDPGARAQVDMWAEWAKQSVANAFTVPVFWRVVRTPEARHDKPAIAAAVATLEAALATAEAELAQRDHLAGDAFTLADIPIGHILYRYYDIDIERAELPHLRAYYERLCARPAYRRRIHFNYDELRNTI